MSDIKPVKQEIVDLSDALTDHVDTVDNGHIAFTKNAFEETLPDDISMADVNKVFNHVKTVTAAQTLSVGNQALGLMEKDKDLNRVTGSMKIGSHGNISTSVDRSFTAKPKPGTKESTTTWGHTTTELTMAAAGGRFADMKSVRGAISEKAAKLFS